MLAFMVRNAPVSLLKTVLYYHKNLIHGQLDIEHKKKLKKLVFSTVQITATVLFLEHPIKKQIS